MAKIEETNTSWRLETTDQTNATIHFEVESAHRPQLIYSWQSNLKTSPDTALFNLTVPKLQTVGGRIDRNTTELELVKSDVSTSQNATETVLKHLVPTGLSLSLNTKPISLLEIEPDELEAVCNAIISLAYSHTQQLEKEEIAEQQLEKVIKDRRRKAVSVLQNLTEAQPCERTFPKTAG